MRRLISAVAFLGWVAFIAAGLARVETNIEDLFPWLPDDTPHRQIYSDFLRRFGSDDVLIVSWDGCTLDDPRVGRLEEGVLARQRRWVHDVITAQDVIGELTSPPANLTRHEAIQQLHSVLVGPDDKTTCLLLHLTTEGMRDRRTAVADIIREAKASCGLEPEQLHLGGQPYVAYFSANVTRNSLIWLSIPVAIIATLLAWWSLRSFRLMFLTLASSGMATITAFAIIPWCGFRVNGLLAALPSLIFVVTTSGVIHVTNYSLWLRRREERHGEALTPGEHAAAVQRKAMLPCLMSAVSTILGTMSLLWSDYPAIRDFGLFSTIGVGLTFFVQIFFVPVWLSYFFRNEGSVVVRDRFAPFFEVVFHGIVRHSRLVLAGMAVVTALLFIPLFRLEGRFSVSRMFSEKSEFVQNIGWLEEHIGPIDATEVVLVADNSAGTGFFSRVRRMQGLEEQLRKVEGVSSTFSAVTMVPKLEHPSVITLFLVRSAIERKRPLLASGTHLSVEGDEEYWRVTLRTPLFGGPSRDELAANVKQVVEQATRHWQPPPQVFYTGSSQMFFETQGDVLLDFASNFVMAFVQILVMLVTAMTFVLWDRADPLWWRFGRGFLAGCLAMLPNIVPCIAVFGVLGWIDRYVDIGMTVAACIALGIAVDDTSHFLIGYYQRLKRAPDDLTALETSYVHNATPVVQTALICGLSMLPYMATSLVYLSRFGLLLATLMVAAMLAELLLLPALLAGPASHLFHSSHHAVDGEAGDDDEDEP